MIIKDIALWLLENTELLPRRKHDKILQQHTRLKIISYYCGMNQNFERCIKFIEQENENLEIKS